MRELRASSPYFGQAIAISPQQATLHAASEAIGVFVVAPFFFYASTRLPTETERAAAFWLGVGSLAVDGFLLWRYLSQTTEQPLVRRW